MSEETAKNTPTETVEPVQDTSTHELHLVRWIIVGVGGLIGLIIVGLIIAIVGGIANSDGVSNFFRILRDFFIIVLALQGILISVALVILVLQVSALINLLRNEIRPIISETREAISTVKGTAQFVSKNVASPIIRTSATIAGVTRFVSELTAIRRNLGLGRGAPAGRLGKGTAIPSGSDKKEIPVGEKKP